MIGRQVVIEVGQQLRELLREVVGRGLAAVALQREGGQRIGAGRTADAEVDAPREQPGEDAEDLGDLEGAVVGQHHAAAADADPRGGRGDRPDQHLRCGTGEHRPAVVLGDPVAVIAEAVRQSGELDRVA